MSFIMILYKNICGKMAQGVKSVFLTQMIAAKVMTLQTLIVNLTPTTPTLAMMMMMMKKKNWNKKMNLMMIQMAATQTVCPARGIYSEGGVAVMMLRMKTKTVIKFKQKI
jgi:hypothetical protein